MNPRERLELLNILLASDEAFDIGTRLLDKDATKYEKEASTFLNKLYRIVHPEFCTAYTHEEWDRESKKALEKIKNKRRGV